MWTFLRGDVWKTTLEENPVGSEQGGARPTLVISNNIGNFNAPTVIVLPLTSQLKNGQPTHVTITADFLPKESVVLAEQIRTVSKGRLTDYLGRLSNEQMQAVEQAVAQSLDLIIKNQRSSEHE